MRVEVYIDGNQHAWACLLVARKPDGTIAKKRLLSGEFKEACTPSEAAFWAAGMGLRAMTAPADVAIFTRVKKLAEIKPPIGDNISWHYLIGDPLQKEVAAEIERVINIKNANELVNTGERMSDLDWLNHTQAMIDAEKRKVGLS
jgi:hypothetical protein